MADYNGKVAIVTGAGGGIGRAISKRLAAAGARLTLADLHAAQADALTAEAKAAGAPDALFQVCDVGVEDQVAAAVKATLDRFGRLDLVVNNAGLMEFKAIEDLTEDDWLKTLKVDLVGSAHFIKHAFLAMKDGGAVVNIASIHAIETTPMVACYAASKAGVLSLTRTASIEGKAKQVRVNAILPGAIDTPMLWDNPNVKSGVEKIDPSVVGKPDDIAAAVAFLGSDDARFITGTTLVVDGGRLARL
jgi:NAD(P)-dependent dehydrogenase (short-subunit alcohol dehydrogenase family)